jgi:hypothetical protein
MRTFLELIRIILILMILGAGGWMLLADLYTANRTAASFSWVGAIALLLLIFVLYRNKLQFSGWYKGKDGEKLPKNLTILLISVSLLLLILPFILGSLFI